MESVLIPLLHWCREKMFRKLFLRKWAHAGIFMTLVFFVITCTHALAFLSIDFFWNLQLSWYTILTTAILLPGVFFLITGWTHRWENALSRRLYFIASLWLGFFSFLFFSVFLTWGMYWLGTFFHGNMPLDWIFFLFFTLSVGAVIRGMYNAFHPRIRHIEVFIRDLPEFWEGKKIIQLSDVHLGAIYGADHFRHIAEMTNAENPEMIVFTGDTFDGMRGSLAEFAEPLSRVRARSGSFFIIGNHETYLGVNLALEVIRKTRIHVLQDAVVDVKGLKLIGLSYPERGKRKRFARRLAQLQPLYEGHPSLLLVHSPEGIKKISRMGISLQLSGHTHYGQMAPYNMVTHLLHKGFDYGKYEMGDYTLYTTNGIGTWGPPIRFGNVPEIVSVTLHKKAKATPFLKKRHSLIRGVSRVSKKAKQTTRRMLARVKNAKKRKES